jgi:DNA-binding NtrC family response regulator
MSEFRLLVVDDEPEVRRLLTKELSQEFETGAAATGAEALQLLGQRSYDVVLLDHGMPGMTGLEALRNIKAAYPDTHVIMITAFHDLSLVIETIRAGAEDFLIKPVVIEAVRQKVRSFSRQHDLSAENHRLRIELDHQHRFDEMLGESPAFLEMLAAVERVSALNIPVLIHGESGTGKELIARAIHRNSTRHERAFVAVNCTALPDTLLTSELFGHARGAFTDAREAKKGLFLAADGGTLFMDEIGETTPSFQAQLLRVLQTGEVLPLGSAATRTVNVRIIAATNRNLERRVESGDFRQDLFFRLWKFPIYAPALRERRADIPLLANSFLRRYGRDLNKNVLAFTEEALRLLVAYAWPGNIRELENVVERAVIYQDGERIESRHLMLGSERQTPAADSLLFEGAWQDAKRRFERVYIRKVLAEAGGNVSKAARIAGMDRGNFRDKMITYGVTSEDAEPMESQS